MEDNYILVQDCIHNLSTQFIFDLLLQLSTTTKYNSNLIYELITDQPIYYSNMNQIRLFHNIHSLTIPKYYSYNLDNNNISNLTHIYEIKFYNISLIDDIIKLTHLTSCVLIEEQANKYFHTNLIKLYDFDCTHEWSTDIYDIISFTHLTHFNVDELNAWIDINDLSSLINLRSLQTGIMKNISNLSIFTALDTLIISRNYLDPNEIYINHSRLTKIITSNIAQCAFQDCGNLKYLQLSDCSTLTINESRSRLQTLILNSHWKHISKKLDFDISECMDLRYLEYNVHNINQLYISSKLNKLNQLFVRNEDDLVMEYAITKNLTYLQLDNCEDTCNFGNYINLRTLVINKSKYIYINRLRRLEHVSISNESASYDNRYINCKNYLNLTYLEVNNIRYNNLRFLTKLKTLICRNMRMCELNRVWVREIQHLLKLSCLHLFLRIDHMMQFELMDTCHLSNLRLKEFHFNFELNNLNHLNELVNLQMLRYSLQYDNTFSTLTKLTNINVSLNIRKLKCKNMHRLNYLCEDNEDENIKLMQPELKIIK